MRLALLAFIAPLLVLSACFAEDGGAAPQLVSAIRFEPGPRLASPRATHRLLKVSDTHLLVIGGCVRRGCEAGPASEIVETIDVRDMETGKAGRLLERRVQPSAIALSGGRVLVIGGWVDGRVSATTEIFDYEEGRSIAGPDLSGPRSSPTVVALADGRVLIAGGSDGERARADAEIFDPVTGMLTPTGALGVARNGATGTLLADGRVLIVGGSEGETRERRALASTELFDPSTGRFVPAASLQHRRYKHAAVRLSSGDVLVIGGSDERDYDGKLRSVERYEVASNRFVSAGELARPRFKLADGVLLLPDDRVLVAAGDVFPEVFDASKGRGLMLDYDLGGQWNYMALIAAAPNIALLAGGYLEGRIVPTDRSWVIHLPKG
ncbi:MAG: Kelch repeat-containing protein [Sphingomonadaceae bacterium]